jgi:hypothetical protein
LPPRRDGRGFRRAAPRYLAPSARHARAALRRAPRRAAARRAAALRSAQAIGLANATAPPDPLLADFSDVCTPLLHDLLGAGARVDLAPGGVIDLLVAARCRFSVDWRKVPINGTALTPGLLRQPWWAAANCRAARGAAAAAAALAAHFERGLRASAGVPACRSRGGASCSGAAAVLVNAAPKLDWPREESSLPTFVHHVAPLLLPSAALPPEALPPDLDTALDRGGAVLAAFGTAFADALAPRKLRHLAEALISTNRTVVWALLGGAAALARLGTRGGGFRSRRAGRPRARRGDAATRAARAARARGCMRGRGGDGGDL